MTKFKTIPNQGTRTIGLPVVGDVEFVDGLVEIEDSQAEQLSKLNFGFQLISTEKSVGKVDEGKPEGGEGSEGGEDEDEPITKESLMGMTTQLMKDFMVDAFDLTIEQVNEITKGKKKEEVADEILERIDAISPTE